MSHDMRLISQVAREIWLCDEKTVRKFTGEISDFKMRLRAQMQRQNLIDGGGEASKASSGQSSMFTAITPSNKFVVPSAVPTIAPIIETFKPSRVDTPEQLKDAVETLSIVSKDDSVQTASTAATTTATIISGVNLDGVEIIDEKTVAKLRKKAEKEAALALQQKEEEERQQRREEKLREMEEAKRLKDEMKRRQEEFLAKKAAEEVWFVTLD